MNEVVKWEENDKEIRGTAIGLGQGKWGAYFIIRLHKPFRQKDKPDYVTMSIYDVKTHSVD